MHKNNLYGVRLKEARKIAGLSQAALGVLAGFDEFSASARMSQYETGKHLPDIGTALRLAASLKIPLAYFFCMEDDLAEFIRLHHRLKKDQKQAVLNLLKTLVNN